MTIQYRYKGVNLHGPTGVFYGTNNNGEEVGIENKGGAQYGLVDIKGKIYELTGPNSSSPTFQGVNDSGDIVGWNYDGDQGFTSFIRKDRQYTKIQIGSAKNSTTAYGINNSDEVVGSWRNATTGKQYGFIDIGGKISLLRYPGAASTTLTGVNDSGEIVGYYTSQTREQGAFLDKNGKFTALHYPGNTSQNEALAINKSGEVLGSYDDANGILHYYIYHNGVYDVIANPKSGAVVSNFGLNNAGDIVGDYQNSSGSPVPDIGTPVSSEGTAAARRGGLAEALFDAALTGGAIHGASMSPHAADSGFGTLAAHSVAHRG